MFYKAITIVAMSAALIFLAMGARACQNTPADTWVVVPETSKKIINTNYFGWYIPGVLLLIGAGIMIGVSMDIDDSKGRFRDKP